MPQAKTEIASSKTTQVLLRRRLRIRAARARVPALIAAMQTIIKVKMPTRINTVTQTIKETRQTPLTTTDLMIKMLAIMGISQEAIWMTIAMADV